VSNCIIYVWGLPRLPFGANRTPTDTPSVTPGFCSFVGGGHELLLVRDGGEPVGEGGGEEVALPLTYALDEGDGLEEFEAGARTRERLTPALCPSVGVHEEGEPTPHRVPSIGTVWDLRGLTVNGYDGG